MQKVILYTNDKNYKNDFFHIIYKENIFEDLILRDDDLYIVHVHQKFFIKSRVSSFSSKAEIKNDLEQTAEVYSESILGIFELLPRIDKVTNRINVYSNENERLNVGPKYEDYFNIILNKQNIFENKFLYDHGYYFKKYLELNNNKIIVRDVRRSVLVKEEIENTEHNLLDILNSDPGFPPLDFSTITVSQLTYVLDREFNTKNGSLKVIYVKNDEDIISDLIYRSIGFYSTRYFVIEDSGIYIKNRLSAYNHKILVDKISENIDIPDTISENMDITHKNTRTKINIYVSLGKEVDSIDTDTYNVIFTENMDKIYEKEFEYDHRNGYLVYLEFKDNQILMRRIDNRFDYIVRLPASDLCLKSIYNDKNNRHKLM